jgi:hypothetical protein
VAGKLPTLEAVLQGSGITVDLSGTLNLGNGITSTFGAVPDVPITAFTLALPAGPHSALAAAADTCAVPLKFTAAILGQNGKTTNVNSVVGVAGCGVQITKASVKRRTATLSVRVPSAGTVVVSAKGIRKVKKTVGAAGTYKVRAKLSKTGAKSLGRALKSKSKKKRGLNVKLTGAFTPKKGSVAGGEAVKASKARKTLTFKKL